MTEAARTDPPTAAPAPDWAAIERLPEFRELVAGRRRFAWTAGGIGIGTGALYVLLAATAHGLMGTRVAGSFTLGFAGGVGLVLMTWAITLAYLRRSARVWAPLEARIREQALGRPEPAAVDRRGRITRRAPAPAPAVTTEVSG
jgi:uncharacterized membrane protein (DUF485 family)